MKFDSSRAFPYPVLRPYADDYGDANIFSTVRFEAEGDESIRIDISMDVGVPELRKLTVDGHARYETIVTCRDTFEEIKFASSDPDYSAILPSGLITGKVKISTYLVATRPITGFSSSLINPEFGDKPFDFANGALLAVYDEVAAYVSREAFKPLSACFEFYSKEDLPDWQVDVAATGHLVQVLVNPEMLKFINGLRQTDGNRAILICSVYMQVVQQCVSLLQNRSDEYDDYRWANIFKQRANNLGIDIMNGSEMRLAQTLLGDPFKHLKKSKVEE